MRPKGFHHIKITKERISGNKHWNFGKHLSKETKNKISEYGSIHQFGSQNPNWKGGFKFQRHRGLGFHKISFEHPGCEWHHVNMMFVVACPKEIHEKCSHHVLGNSGIHAHFLEGILG